MISLWPWISWGTSEHDTPTTIGMIAAEAQAGTRVHIPFSKLKDWKKNIECSSVSFSGQVYGSLPKADNISERLSPLGSKSMRQRCCSSCSFWRNSSNGIVVYLLSSKNACAVPMTVSICFLIQKGKDSLTNKPHRVRPLFSTGPPVTRSIRMAESGQRPVSGREMWEVRILLSLESI